MDSGYDESQNPFADVSEEYMKKKEENMAKKAVKRMSAQQRQINKVTYLLPCDWASSLDTCSPFSKNRPCKAVLLKENLMVPRTCFIVAKYNAIDFQGVCHFEVTQWYSWFLIAACSIG